MAKVSVIIPCYKARETLSRALHSIAMQSIADEVEVVVVNDCDHLYYDDIIRQFPDLDICYYQNDINKGCGGARNTGMKYATADYICFLDADDCFTNCLALEIMYERIKAEKADVLVSVFESEQRYPDGVAIKKMAQQLTWCHGKLYDRRYLFQNAMLFDENLRINEDTAFHQLLFDLGAKIIELPMTTLLWRDNPKSVTHESLYKNKRAFIDAIISYLNEAMRRKLPIEKIRLRILQNLVMAYLYYNIVLDDSPENAEDYLNACRQYWEIAEPITNNVSDEYITEVYLAIMKTATIIPTVSFTEFLDELRTG